MGHLPNTQRFLGPVHLDQLTTWMGRGGYTETFPRALLHDMGGGVQTAMWWCASGVGGLCDYWVTWVTPVPIWLGFGFGTALGLGLGLRRPDLGLGLDNLLSRTGIHASRIHQLLHCIPFPLIGHFSRLIIIKLKEKLKGIFLERNSSKT